MFKVIHIPFDVEAKNPYQTLLKKSLESNGISVVGKRYTPHIWYLVASERANALHFHWLHLFIKKWWHSALFIPYFVVQLFIIKYFFRCEIFWTAHNIKNHEGRALFREYFISYIVSLFAKSVIVHSEFAVNIIKHRYLFPKKKITMIPHGHYIDWYPNIMTKEVARKQLNINKSKLVFLFIGIIRNNKGIFKLIEAFLDWQNQDSCLIIAGKPNNFTDEQNRYFDKIHTQAKSRVKIFPSFVPDVEIQTFMNAADVVVFPYDESVLTSGALILAMSFGKPIVGLNYGVFSELLDSDSGYLMPAINTIELKLAFEFVNANYDKLKSMGNRNLQKAKKLDWDQIAKAHKDLYS